MASLMKSDTKKIATRLRLINWHCFHNALIPLVNDAQMFDKDGTYILNGMPASVINGKGAVGKSIIMDAIQYVQVCDPNHFNKASAVGKRTLESYVREKRVDGSYARKDFTVSYIALEWYEEKAQKFFVTGVQITYKDSGSDAKKNWFCEEGKLENFNFLTNKKPTIDSDFKNKGKDIVFLTKDSEAYGKFRRRWGELNSDFRDILWKGLAFKADDSVQEFIRKSILQEDDIKIDELRTSIDTLKALEVQLSDVRKKIVALQEIMKVNDEIDGLTFNIQCSELISSMVELDILALDIKKKQERVQNLKLTLESLEREETKKKEEIEIEEKKVEDLNKVLYNSDEKAHLEKLEEEVKRLTKESGRYAQKAEQLKECLTYVNTILNTFPELNAEFSSLSEMTSANIPVDGRIATAMRFDENVQTIKREKFEVSVDKKREKENLSKRLSEKNKEIDELKRNRKQYPYNVTLLKTEIEKEFARMQYQTSVYILSDVLSITDERWRNAVEGYLNTQKFYLIVEPRYYDTAIKVYRRLKNIHSAGIINLAKIQESETKEGSLASVITSENSNALKYARYLLNPVVMCDKVEDLKQYPVAVTSDCMLYKNYVTRRIDPHCYEKPFIGKEAIERQLTAAEEEKKDLEREYCSVCTELDTIETHIERLNRHQVNVLQQVIEAPVFLAETNNQLAEAEKKANDYRSSDAFRSIFSVQAELDERKKRLSDLREEKDSCAVKRGKLNTEIDGIESQLQYHVKDYANKEQSLHEKESQNIDAFQEAQRRYEERRKNKDLKDINEEKTKERWETLRENKKGKLLELQGRYDSGNLGIGLNYIEDYKSTYDKLKDSDSMRLEEELKKMQAITEETFKEDFLTMMKERIEKAYDLKNNLNKVLKNLQYVGRTYKFVFEEKSDKKKYLDMIMSEDNLGANTLFSDSFEEEYKDVMDELFETLRSSTDEKIVKEFVDYRSYLNCDIEVTPSNGKPFRLSGKTSSDSGSEKEISYYIITAAAFVQMYKDRETSRIMMIDEAFLKCDAEVCRKLVSFIKSYNLQLILSSPDNKNASVLPLFDNIINVVKDDKTDARYIDDISHTKHLDMIQELDTEEVELEEESV